MVFEAQPSAALYISLRTARNLGVVNVVANEDEAELYINGDKYRRTTKRGRLIVYLVPKKYTLRLQKDGFAPTPDQTVDVHKGDETKLTFNLQPAKATLAVHHAPPNAEVWIDGARVGIVRSDGEFSTSTLEPGRHTVSLRHDRFKPLQTDVTLSSGKAVDLQGTLENTLGTLKVDISPAGLDVHLRIRREGESQDRDFSGSSLSLAEGSYTVTGTAAQYQNAVANVHITANAIATASLVFKKADTAPKTVAKAPPSTPVFGPDDWVKAGGWTRQDNMIVHQGGDYVLATPNLTQGTIRFTAVILKGKRLEWVLAFRDNKNYLFFQVDDKNLTRYEVVNGGKASQVKIPHKLDRKQPMSFTISVTSNAVIHSVQQGGEWVILDNWSVLGSLVHGQFGFHIPGGDQIGLTDFRLAAN